MFPEPVIWRIKGETGFSTDALSASSYTYAKLCSNAKPVIVARLLRSCTHFTVLSHVLCAMPAMYLYRTPKALLELAPGQRQLGLRERSVLLLAESTPASKLHSMYHGQGQALVQQLLDDGYLQHHTSPVLCEQHPTGRPDNVSLAGVRMHLFDLCERMFANRLHDTAAHLRHQLREARDVDSMLHASEQLLQAVHRYAGLERAQALRKQLALMLPERSLENGDESALS